MLCACHFAKLASYKSIILKGNCTIDRSPENLLIILVHGRFATVGTTQKQSPILKLEAHSYKSDRLRQI
jgi:hypothetical protein